MKFVNSILSVLCLVAFAACVSPFEYVDTEILETRQQLRADLEAAEASLVEGEISKNEYDELVAQAKEIAEDRLQAIPGGVKDIVEQNAETLKERGKGFLLTVTDVVLMLLLGTGAGASGLIGLQRRRNAPPAE